ncbi:hypothetical protein Mth01_57990 [Sphaerimonospora thailandensis]|uniref:Uncharacterized protein n=1 Tax=Sphaerimonospora thailandensis TaxID=795644 RepID=A0A8J3W376_9ACTN|nr:hypothetical protein Mth01_57990 [Sphaerimonospora thailandensis]
MRAQVNLQQVNTLNSKLIMHIKLLFDNTTQQSVMYITIRRADELFELLIRPARNVLECLPQPV